MSAPSGHLRVLLGVAAGIGVAFVQLMLAGGVRADEAGVPSAPQITLKEVLRSAERDPSSVRAATATLARVDAQRGYAEGAYFPSLTGQVAAGVAYENQLILPSQPRVDFESLEVESTLTFDWSLFNMARGYNIDSAREELRAQGYATENAKREAVQEAAELYVRAQAAVALIEDAALTVDRRTSEHAAIRDLVRAGVHPPVDATRAEVEMVSARHAFVIQQIEARAAFAALAASLGRDPASSLRPDTEDTPGFAVSFSPERARAEAAKNRPELSQLLAADESKRSLYDAAVGARLPTLGITATGSASYGQPIGGPEVIEGALYNASAVAYIRWSGLDPAVWGRAGVAEAETLESRRTLQGAQLSVGAEAVAAAYAAARAKEEVDRAAAVLTAAQAVREAQNGRYKAGFASLLELLDAEELEQQARRDRILSRRDYELAGADLLSACGLLARLAR